MPKQSYAIRFATRNDTIAMTIEFAPMREDAALSDSSEGASGPGSKPVAGSEGEPESGPGSPLASFCKRHAHTSANSPDPPLMERRVPLA